MKIITNKVLDNGVCQASLATSDFSAQDQSLMQDFSEPIINVGGVFSTGGKAAVTGSANLSAGYNFSTLSPTFSLTYGSGDAHVATLSLNCANLAGVVAHIQTQINGIFGLGVFEVVATTNYVTIRTARAGASYHMVLAAGSVNDALAILGITAATYTGSGNDDFLLAEALARVKTDSPFVAGFDSRDTSLERAMYMGNTWAAEIVVRIEAAMDALRENADEYTTESMITY